MVQRVSQTQIYLHNNNYNTELNPCQVYNPFIVESEGSKVILNGTVHSWMEKEEAASAAWSAPGVSDVVNNLVILGPSEIYGQPAI